MHIPEGFLSNGVAITMDVVSGATLAYSIKGLRQRFNWAKMLFAAGITALIFALQMLNFPVVEGTSGHFMGAALAAILFGPAGAIIVIAVVLAVQCFVFGDGGVLALGSNIFNMGVVGGLTGYYTYNWLKGMFKGVSGVLFNAFISSWASIVMASGSCAVMLGVSGTGPTMSIVTSMISTHTLIGVGEGLITLVIIGLTYRFKPLLMDQKAEIDLQAIVKPCVIVLGVALALAVFVTPYVCPYLDGLERVAEDHGFLSIAEGKEMFCALIPDYVLPGIKSEAIATSLAGFVGIIIAFVFFFLTAGVVTFGAGKRVFQQPANGGKS